MARSFRSSVVTPELSQRRHRCDRESSIPRVDVRWLSKWWHTVEAMTAAEQAFAFLRSPDGRAMVTRALQRRGLPLGLRDDLVGEIMRRVVSACGREPLVNPAGFATHCAQYAAADLLRGQLRSPLP